MCPTWSALTISDACIPFAHDLIQAGEIGDITWFRCEHTEDFLSDPNLPKTGDAKGWPRATWAIWPPPRQRRPAPDGPN